MSIIEELSISSIQEMFNSKKISVMELVEEYLKRIALYDQGENKLNSILEINPDVRAIAKELDGQKNESRSKLHGVPILLKDNIDTADRMHTSAGSLALGNSFASSDSEIVKALRQKGAIILGKTNMTEFANYMTKGMKAGYSSKGGEVKSPYKWDQDPSGSSTGSAVAVSANLCAVSIGTDTSGSIIGPAKTNGIVGFRPTIGALSLKGIIPISFTLDTVGPMTRTVLDSAILFSELTNTLLNKEEGNIKDLVIGVDTFENLSKEEEKKATEMIKELKKSGAVIKRLYIPQVSKHIIKEIGRYEFKYSLNRYLDNLPQKYPIHSLKDIIDFNIAHQEKTLRYGQTLLIDAQENTTGDLSEIAYKRLLQEREIMKLEVNKQLRGIDLCIQFKDSLIFQYVGLPIITIPLGLYNNGMPNGISLTSRNDIKLLTYARVIEQIIGSRVPPKL